MKNNYKKQLMLLVSIALVFTARMQAQISWPDNQLLPSFPAAATTQDFFLMNGSVAPYARSWRWQAEADVFTHQTGSAETDGWLCQVGIDAANQYMIGGRVDSTITMGPNVAEFRMKIDNNILDDNAIVDIDVRHLATGKIWASQTITRSQFTSAGSYISFKLPFMALVDSQAVEFRVLWRGIANTKVDYVGVTQDNSGSEQYLFSSMKGIVNKTKPRIFTYDGDAAAEGPYTWLQSLGLNWLEQSNGWVVLSKYKKEISGLIVYDPTQIHTVNLATMMARDKNAIIASPSLLSKLTSSPYYYPILADLRGQFSSKLEVYQAMFDNYWPAADHRLLIGLNPDVHKASLREYATALGVAVVWLDPLISAESAMLNKFLASMPAGSNYMGWWPEEAPGVTRVSAYGITTIASDFCTNLTVHSGMSRNINIKPMPEKPTLQNKIYVAFILSDGDNLQYVEHLMRKLWNNSDRGSVPIGWTLSPAMVDAMPGALNYYHTSSTVNDNLISGPSGYGYTYPNYWQKVTALNQYAAKTEEYNNQAGFRVITIWNTITGGIASNVGQTFASYAPTLLGLTGQNTGGAMSIYKLSLPGMPLSCNYCTNEQAMKDHIASAASGWTKTKPRFVIIQAQPWSGVTPTSFKNVMNSLTTDYSVVRPDHLFQLMREANNLTVNPGAIEGAGNGLSASFYNGTNFETSITSTDTCNISADWGTASPAAGVNADAFSVRWQGKIQPRYSGVYTFYVTSDSYRRLWINDQLVIDKWLSTAGTYTGTIALVAGQKYNLKLEYADLAGIANCKLEWASPLQSREIVPRKQLFDILSSIDNGNTNSESEICITPNPVTNGVMNIKLSSEIGNEATIKLMDLCGKTLLTDKVTQSKQINISSVTAGTYIVSVCTKNRCINKKIMVE